MKIEVNEKYIIIALVLVVISIGAFFAASYIYVEHIYKPIYTQGQVDILNRVISEKEISFVGGNIVFYSDTGCQERCLKYIRNLVNASLG